jgi:hypothetical protein
LDDEHQRFSFLRLKKPNPTQRRKAAKNSENPKKDFHHRPPSAAHRGHRVKTFVFFLF